MASQPSHSQTLPAPRTLKPQIPLTLLNNPRLRRPQLIQLLLVLLDSTDDVDQHRQKNRRRKMARLAESSTLEPSKKRFPWRWVPRWLVGWLGFCSLALGLTSFWRYMNFGKVEYRIWKLFRSKLAAASVGGV